MQLLVMVDLNTHLLLHLPQQLLLQLRLVQMIIVIPLHYRQQVMNNHNSKCKTNVKEKTSQLMTNEMHISMAHDYQGCGRVNDLAKHRILHQ